ncbi:hypothetical protein NDS46_23345 [Paenibacillus thiaminolyticus]|uniref:hypothetical protein n=1 Tax=Paenibacillus thiaminolyticus TaxID=49283 RepID=UPI00232B5CFB|nr:hypothetical protein [Paenibacillus thiaminolyticus]WCF07239.1 hypothetical protein NDS46_23345 [Paenibacillus thiaminolyticus]
MRRLRADCSDSAQIAAIAAARRSLGTALSPSLRPDHGTKKSLGLSQQPDLRGPRDAPDPGGIIAFWRHRGLQEASSPLGGIVASWGLNMWRELLLFYRNFGSMSLHPKELLQIYIILGPFAPSRSETGEIPAVLQDSLSSEIVHIELLYFRRISPTE